MPSAIACLFSTLASHLLYSERGDREKALLIASQSLASMLTVLASSPLQWKLRTLSVSTKPV